MTKPIVRTVKGRAIAARPLVFVSALSVLALLLFAPAAGAELMAPVLTATNPASPGASPTLFVQGEIPPEGGETKVVAGIGLRALGPSTRANGAPGNTVKLYTDASCSSEIGEGEVQELEGAGIQVTVSGEVTTLYAKQFDPLEVEAPSPCSAQGLRYRYVSSPPEAPVFESVNPASPADQNFPSLIGAADAEATVSIYVGSACSGAPAATGTGVQFGEPGIQVSVPDNSETTFSANASLAGFLSPCSVTPISYQEVTPVTEPGGGTGGGGDTGGGVSPANPVSPPRPPRLRTIPGGTANDNTPIVTGEAPGAATVRIYADPSCSGSPVVKASAAEFQAGLPIRVVENDVTVLSAQSVAGGKASNCSDPVVYVEDSLAPRTRITMGPASKTARRKAIFRFADTTGNAPGTVFRCKVNKARWRKCRSPLRLKHLRPRRYVVRVKATDPAGNRETKGAKRRFKVISRR